MALDMEKFAAVYPILWHVTTPENADRIRRTKVLESAAALMEAASDETWLRQKRPHDVPLRIGDEIVVLRDQQPLYEGHIQWEGGWNLSRLVEEINRRIFFWPGDRVAPIRKAAQNIRDFLITGDHVTIRIPFDAVRHTSGVHLEYARCNAGAPRTVNGKKAIRGPRTFQAHGAWTDGVAAVREVAIVHSVPLTSFWDEVFIG